MKMNIMKRFRRYLYITLGICLSTTFGVEIVNEISFSTKSIASDSKEALGFLSNFKYLSVLLAGAVAWISSIAKDIELHKSIDEMTIDARSETGNIIIGEMRDAANEVCGTNQSAIGDRDAIMNLFYRFVNKFDETRDLAFEYWEDYYVRLYAISLLFLGLLYTVLFSIYELIVSIYYPLYVSGPIVLALFLLLLYKNLKDRLIDKIYRLPKQQVGNIKSTYRDELEEEVQKRFT